MENFKFNGTCYFSSFYEYFQWEQLMIYQQFWWYFFQTKKMNAQNRCSKWYFVGCKFDK
jgi:hypothetical protein